jgi:hypothetical protein
MELSRQWFAAHCRRCTHSIHVAAFGNGTQTDGVGVHIDAKTSAFKLAATILNRTSFQIIQQ